MKAILLAAGFGSRLGSHTQSRPKSLLDMGGRTLIERNLASLQQAGVEEAYVVTGHFSNQITQALAGQFSSGFLHLLHNPDYPLGSGSSLLCASGALHGEVLVIEADLLFHKDLPARMMNRPQINVIAVGHYHNDQVEGQIQIEDGFVSRISWERNTGASTGEWVGMTKLSATACRDLRYALENASRDWRKDEFQYSDFLFDLMPRHQFQAISIDDLPWIEVDTEVDLMRARQEIVPALQLAECSEVSEHGKF